MSFEANYNTLTAGLRKTLSPVQITNESILRADGVEIGKVLSINATPIINNTIIEKNSVRVSGVIEYMAMYEKIDGMKESLSNNAEFSAVINVEGISENPNICLNAMLVDVPVKEVTGERITVNSLIEINGYVVINNEVKYLNSATGDVFYQTEDICYSQLKTKINANYLATQEIDISELPLRLLHLSATPLINSVITAEGYVTVAGVVTYSICYEYANNDATDVKEISNTFNFKYEIDCPNCTATDVAFVTAKNIRDGVNAEIDSQENSTNIKLNVNFNMCGEVCSENQAQVVSDVFSLSQKLQLTYSSFAYTKSLGAKSSSEKIFGITEISEESARIDKILCVLDSNAVVTKAFCDEYNLNIEGIAYTTVVYLNAEESVESKMQIEIPFTSSMPIENMSQNCQVQVNSLLTDVIARIRRGREIEIDANLMVYANFYETKIGAVISNVIATEDRICNKNALSIYVAKDNDTAWTIAKKMCINPAEVLEQNPQLADGIKKGDKVIIYRQHK